MGITGFLAPLLEQWKQVAWTASSKLRLLLEGGCVRVDLLRELAVPTARAWMLCRMESRCLGGGPTGPLASGGSGEDSKAERARIRGTAG